MKPLAQGTEMVVAIAGGFRNPRTNRHNEFRVGQRYWIGSSMAFQQLHNAAEVVKAGKPMGSGVLLALDTIERIFCSVTSEQESELERARR